MNTKIDFTDLTNGNILNYKNLKISFDGSCEPKNPGGVASIGWLIKNAICDTVLITGFQIVADGGKFATNNFAEYCALGMPLRWLLDQGWKQGTVHVTGDSKLVVEQVSENWQCNAPHLIALRERVFQVLEELDLKSFNIEWVPRNLNEEADSLGRKAYEAYCLANKRPVRYMPKRKKK